MEYYARIAACKTEKELFELWKQKEPIQTTTTTINHRNVFISDGIVNKEVWNDPHSKKILFVLKEAYGESDDWNLVEWLQRVKPSSSIWKRVIEWTYGIQNTNSEGLQNIYRIYTNQIQTFFLTRLQ